jgi:hypothetical protein
MGGGGEYARWIGGAQARRMTSRTDAGEGTGSCTWSNVTPIGGVAEGGRRLTLWLGARE